MALIADGRVFEGQTYMFVNKAYPNRALNVWCSSSYPATNQSNVCLWTKDTTDTAQHWVIDRIGTTNYILKPVENSAKALDLYTGTGTGANSNAQLYTPSETSYLEFDVGGYSDTVHIKLAGTTNNGYFLTAYSDANGTRTGKSNTSAGNVFFQKYEIFDDRKEWIPVPIGTTSGGDTGNTGNENDIVIPSSKYTYYCQQDYPWVNGAYGITTSNFRQTGCAAIACTMFMQIMANNPLIKPEDLFEWGVMSNNDGYPWASWSTAGAPVNYIFAQVDTWSSAKSAIYNQLIIGQPVIIHLNGSDNGSHYVVGCGLKAGTNASNMTYDDIYVLDPWDFEHKTLQETMNHTNKWNTFDNVRIAE